MKDERRFIIWDTKDDSYLGSGPRKDESGEFVSDGLIGRVGVDNVYLATYANYKDNKTHRDLDVGECIWAKFTLSGESGLYQVWRVK